MTTATTTTNPQKYISATHLAKRWDKSVRSVKETVASLIEDGQLKFMADGHPRYRLVDIERYEQTVTQPR